LGTAKSCIIINSWDVDGSLAKGVIKTDSGDYNVGESKGVDYLGKKVNAIIDSSNNMLSFGEVIENSKVMFVYNISGNNIWAETKYGSINETVPDSMYFYYKGEKSLFSTIKTNVLPGSIIALSITGVSTNSYDYGVLIDPNEYQPIVVKKDISASDNSISGISINDKSKYTVIKDGEKVLFADIRQNDVLYNIKNPFKENSGILLVYDNKVTGTYDSAYPTKNLVTKVTILNKEYEIETASAGQKLNSNEYAYKIGDKITLLLGAKGKIVDVIRPKCV
jgi:hypothetical protein